MPIYEYKCGDCGHITEFLEHLNSDSPHACEKCGGNKMSKVMSVFSAAVDGKSITNSGADTCSTCGTHNCSTCGH